MARPAKQVLTILARSCYLMYLIAVISAVSTFRVDKIKRAKNPLPVAKNMLELVSAKIEARPELQ